jgi:hypothetical protein
MLTINPATATFAELDAFVAALAEQLTTDERESWRLFYEGDHWQMRKGWSGPRPKLGSADERARWDRLERAFTPENKIAEIVDRHANAVIGKEPHWSFTVQRALAPDEELTAPEQKLTQEAEALLTRWWDERECHQVLWNGVRDQLLEGRGIRRLFVPAGEVKVTPTGENQIPRGSIEESLNRIWPEAPLPKEAIIVRDRRTMQPFGLFLQQVELPKPDAPGEVQVSKVYELTYLDEQGLTRLRVVPEEGEAQVTPGFPLNGNLLLYQQEARALLSDTVLRQQKTLNKTLTALSINVDSGAWQLEVWINADLPGEEQIDRNGKTIFKPDPIDRGPGAFNNIVGKTVVGLDGKETLVTPDVKWRDPVNVEMFERTTQMLALAIYSEAHQRHALLSGDAVASGEARKQALADFAMSLLKTTLTTQRAGRWLLDTALRFASALAGEPRRFDKLRPVFQCRLDLGPVSADERRMVIAEVNARLRDRGDAMRLIGVEDTEATMRLIEADEAARQEREKEMLQFKQTLTPSARNAT